MERRWVGGGAGRGRCGITSGVGRCRKGSKGSSEGAGRVSSLTQELGARL